MTDGPSGPDRPALRRCTRRGVLAAGASLVIPAVVAEDPAHRSAQLARAHLDQRLPEIRLALAAAPPGFTLLVGNSHAEIFGAALTRLRPVINAGIGGTSARGYAAQIDTLAFGSRAGIALLFLGTNDILRRGNPLSSSAIGGFSVAAARILDWLRAWTDLVLVAAVPPLGPEAAVLRDPAAVDAYSAALRDLCERPGCRYFDPFAELRDGGVGLTTQAAVPDGVHLRDYDTLAAELARLLCEIGPVRQPPQVRP